jgi:hypothetical protein
MQRLSCAIGKYPRMPILNNFIYHHIAHVHFPVAGWLMEQSWRIEISGNAPASRSSYVSETNVVAKVTDSTINPTPCIAQETTTP